MNRAVLIRVDEHTDERLLAPGAPVIEFCPGSALHLKRGWTLPRGRIVWDLGDEFMITSRTHGACLLLRIDEADVVEGFDRADRVLGGCSPFTAARCYSDEYLSAHYGSDDVIVVGEEDDGC